MDAMPNSCRFRLPLGATLTRIHVHMYCIASTGIGTPDSQMQAASDILSNTRSVVLTGLKFTSSSAECSSVILILQGGPKWSNPRI